MTLCPPGLSFSPSLFPPSSPSPSVWPHSSPHPSASVSPPWPHPAGRPLDPSRVRAHSLPQVSVCSPRAARVSGGLWGRRSPLQLGLQQSPSPQEACLENIPAQEGLRWGRPAPRARGRHNDGPAHTQIHTRRPLATNTRAHAHSPAHPEPRGQCPDGRRAHPGPESAQTAPHDRPGTHSPCHPQTRKHAPRARPGPPGAAPAPSAPAVSPGRAPGPSRRRSLRASPLLGPGAAAAGWARPAAAPRCLVTGTPGAGRGGEREPPHSAPCPDAPPRWDRPRSPAPPETPPLAARLNFSQQSPAPLGRPRPLPHPAPDSGKLRPPLCLRNSLASLRWFGDSPVSLSLIPRFRLPDPALISGDFGVLPETGAPPLSLQAGAFALGVRPLSPPLAGTLHLQAETPPPKREPAELEERRGGWKERRKILEESEEGVSVSREAEENAAIDSTHRPVFSLARPLSRWVTSGRLWAPGCPGTPPSFPLAHTHYLRSHKGDGDLWEHAAPSGPGLSRDLSVYARCHALCFEQNKAFNFWEAGTIIPHFTDEKTELYKPNLDVVILLERDQGQISAV